MNESYRKQTATFLRTTMYIGLRSQCYVIANAPRHWTNISRTRSFSKFSVQFFYIIFAVLIKFVGRRRMTN